MAVKRQLNPRTNPYHMQPSYFTRISNINSTVFKMSLKSLAVVFCIILVYKTKKKLNPSFKLNKKFKVKNSLKLNRKFKNKHYSLKLTQSAFDGEIAQRGIIESEKICH